MNTNFEEMRHKLGGLYMLPITPFKANFDLDLEGMRKNIRYLLDNGIKGDVGFLVPGAGTGEGIYLSLEEHRNLVKTVLDEVDGEIPVFPGIHIPGSLEAEMYCKQLQDMGVTGIQLAPPAAYPIPSEDDVVAHYKRVVEAVPNLAILVYNNHWEWGSPPHRDMTPNLLGRLLEIRNVVGVKWSSKTLANFTACLHEHAGKCAFFNNADIKAITIPFYMMGGKGIVVYQIAPWYSLKLKSLLEEGKYAEAWGELNRWIIPYLRLETVLAGEGKSWIALAKAALEVSGLHAGPPRPPQAPLTSAQYARVESLIEKSGILVKANFV